MVAFPAIAVKPGRHIEEKAARTVVHEAPGCSGRQMFYISNSWPWQSEEELEYPHNISTSHAQLALPGAVCQTSEATYKPRQRYSLSSHAAHSSTRSLTNSSSTSSSRSRSRHDSHATFSPAVLSPSPSPIQLQQFTSLWDDDDEDASSGTHHDLAPIHPSDFMKTLLSQLSACISSIKTAYAHQQAALNPYNMQLAAINGGEGCAAAIVSKTDKAMVEELHNLSHLHSQLALLPNMLTFKAEGAEELAAVDVAQEKDSMMLQIMKRYEGIITRFHDEIWRKKAVTEALKETLVKSMLKGEKLQQHVQALEAKLTPLHTH